MFHTPWCSFLAGDDALVAVVVDDVAVTAVVAVDDVAVTAVVAVDDVAEVREGLFLVVIISQETNLA